MSSNAEIMESVYNALADSLFREMQSSEQLKQLRASLVRCRAKIHSTFCAGFKCCDECKEARDILYKILQKTS